MQRVTIVGTSGSGKSTLSEQLAARLNLPFVEVDALYWQPGWQAVPAPGFRELVDEALAGEQWVIGGNYGKVRDIVLNRADTLIWLDYPMLLCLWRVLKRSIKRIITQEDLWGTGNRETWRAQFFSRHSMVIWVLKSHHRYRRDYSQLLENPEYAHLQVLRFRSPQDTERWFTTLNTGLNDDRK